MGIWGAENGEAELVTIALLFLIGSGISSLHAQRTKRKNVRLIWVGFKLCHAYKL